MELNQFSDKHNQSRLGLDKYTKLVLLGAISIALLILAMVLQPLIPSGWELVGQFIDSMRHAIGTI